MYIYIYLYICICIYIYIYIYIYISVNMYMILCHLSGSSYLFSGTLIGFTDFPSFCIGNLFGSLRVAFEAVF